MSDVGVVPGGPQVSAVRGGDAGAAVGAAGAVAAPVRTAIPPARHRTGPSDAVIRTPIACRVPDRPVSGTVAVCQLLADFITVRAAVTGSQWYGGASPGSPASAVGDGEFDVHGARVRAVRQLDDRVDTQRQPCRVQVEDRRPVEFTVDQDAAAAPPGVREVEGDRRALALRAHHPAPGRQPVLEAEVVPGRLGGDGALLVPPQSGPVLNAPRTAATSPSTGRRPTRRAPASRPRRPRRPRRPGGTESSDAPVQNRLSAAWKSSGVRRSSGRWLRVHSGRYRPIDVMCALSRGTIASQFSEVFQPSLSTSTPAPQLVAAAPSRSARPRGGQPVGRPAEVHEHVVGGFEERLVPVVERPCQFTAPSTVIEVVPRSRAVPCQRRGDFSSRRKPRMSAPSAASPHRSRR